MLYQGCKYNELSFLSLSNSLSKLVRLLARTLTYTANEKAENEEKR